MILSTLALIPCHVEYRSSSLLGTLYYALDEMDKKGDTNIKLTVESHKMDVAGMKRGMNVEAFKDEKFDKDLYAKTSRLRSKLQAQGNPLETICLVLNDKEKKRLNTSMITHQERLKTDGFMKGKIC